MLPAPKGHGIVPKSSPHERKRHAGPHHHAISRMSLRSSGLRIFGALPQASHAQRLLIQSLTFGRCDQPKARSLSPFAVRWASLSMASSTLG